MASGREEVPYEAIQTDSRWRDAVVLYAEVASKEGAAEMAEHAWKYAQMLETISLAENQKSFVVARHALRFMIDGFRNRLEIVAPFQDSLSRIIARKLGEGDDLIEIKTVAEAIGLLPPELSCALIQRVVTNYPGWISESAAASARYLPKIDQGLQFALFENVVNRPAFEGLRESKRQEGVFVISNAFGSLANWLRWFRINVYKSWGCLFVTIVAVFVHANDLVLKALFGGVFVFFAPRIIFLLRPFDPSALPRAGKKRSSFEEVASVLRGTLLHLNITSMAAVVLAFTAFFLIFVVIMSHLPTPRLAGAVDKIVDLNSILFFVALCLLGSISISPKPWIRARQAIRWSLIGRVAVGFISLVATWVGMLLLLLLMPKEWLEKYGKIVSVIILVVGATGVILGAFSVRLILAFDYRRFRLATKIFIPDRSQIATQLLSMRTGFFLGRYIEWLDRMSVDHLGALRSPDNSWPAGKRPPLGNEFLSARLAQIEAGWLDLN